jgi:hypothetical protein
VAAQPPGPIAYLNPFLAQAEIAPTDALCGSDNSLRYYCRFRDTFVSNRNGVIFVNGRGDNGGGVVINGGVAIPVPAGGAPANVVGKGGVLVPLPGPLPDPTSGAVQFGSTDTIWTKTVAGWLILSVVFLVLSIQFVSPTRRWRFRRGSRAIEESA